MNCIKKRIMDGFCFLLFLIAPLKQVKCFALSLKLTVVFGRAFYQPLLSLKTKNNPNLLVCHFLHFYLFDLITRFNT